MQTPLATLLALSAALAACEASHGAPTPDAGTDVAAAAMFLADYHRSTCEHLRTCPTGTAQALSPALQLAALRPDACAEMTWDDGWVLAAVRDDAYSFDPLKAAACLAAVAGSECACPSLTNWAGNPAACVGALQPRAAAPGGRCRPAECALDEYCLAARDLSCGTCVPATPIGDPCVAHADCHGYQEICDHDRCATVTDAPPAPLGAACGLVGTVSTSCAGSQVFCLAGVCVSASATGASCPFSPYPCPAGDSCAASAAAGSPMICTAAEIVDVEGAPCATDPFRAERELLCDETLGLVCGSDQLCHRVTGGVGDPCDPLLRCTAPLVCSAGACTPPAADGASCTSPRECASGHCACGTCSVS